MVRDDKKKRERRRKKKKYGQTQVKHSKRGIISCVLAGVVLVINAIILMVAYKNAGRAASYIGGLGLVTVVMSGTGLYMALHGMKERNKQKATCKIGIACNGVLLLIMIGIFCRGLF